MLAKFISLIFISISLSTMADILPKKKDDMNTGDRYVRITKVGTNSVVFQDCRWELEDRTCSSPLARKAPFTLDELKQQRSYEKIDIFVWAAGDAVIMYYGGAAIYVIARLAGVAGYSLEATLSFFGGVGLGVAAVKFISSINALEQYRQARVLREAIINDDADVIVSNIEKTISRLNFVLAKIY